MEVKISKSFTHFEDAQGYEIAPTGEYEPTISIDSTNRISIGLVPPKESQKPTIHIILGRQVSNELIMMIQRLGFRTQGAGALK